MSDLGFNSTGLILAIVALIPVGCRVLFHRLPARRFKKLKKEFDETLDYFHQVLEEGLLPDPDFVEECQEHLNDYHQAVESLRADTCCAVTLKDQCIALYNGLSHAIDDKRKDVSELHVMIVSTSEKQRQELAERRRRQGDRSIYNIRKCSDIETLRDLYQGDFNIALPSRPSSIHNDVAIPRIVSVRRQTTLVADDVNELNGAADKLFLGRDESLQAIYAESLPLRCSAPPISEAQVSQPIKMEQHIPRSADNRQSPVTDTSASAVAIEGGMTTTPCSLRAETLTPLECEEAEALASRLATIQQELAAVAQQLQERQQKK
ncbi:hypothetical protein K474DRAFT_1661249 [Panus rudis PR-1116 ss-1]|nr:hypothetical protein K474DRAFT_1661249 [Panus rudis PR-1116 ss-1]